MGDVEEEINLLWMLRPKWEKFSLPGVSSNDEFLNDTFDGLWQGCVLSSTPFKMISAII